MNQYYDPPFWRDGARRAPFNVYTAVAPLRDFLTTRHWDAPKWNLEERPWAFAEEDMSGAGDSGSMSVWIPYSTDARLMVDWLYDPVRRQYLREQGGRAHRDADGTQIAAMNVVVLRVRSQVLDAVGRLRIPAIESSSDTIAATVYSGGRRIVGKWSADAASGGFGLRVPSGELMTLLSGTTWIEIANVGVR